MSLQRAGTVDKQFAVHLVGAGPLGLLRTMVTAAPDNWIIALERFGTLPFHEVAQPTIRCAREFFCVHSRRAQFIAQWAEQYRLLPQNAESFLPYGKLPEEGDLFVQTDLAAALQDTVSEGQAAADGALPRGEWRLAGDGGACRLQV